MNVKLKKDDGEDEDEGKDDGHGEIDGEGDDEDNVRFKFTFRI
jgi:hypothetical protein